MSPLSSILSRGKDGADVDAPVDDAAVAAPAAGPALAPLTAVRVNLLPPEIAEAAAFRRGQIARAGAVAAAVLVVAGLTVASGNSVNDAEETLAAEQARSTQLQARVSELSIVPETQLRLDTAREQLRAAMGAEVNWATYLNAIGIRMPEGISLTDMKITQTVDAPPAGADAATAAAATGPVSILGTPGIASVTFNGQALSHNHVAKFLEKLDNAKIGNVDPYFTSAKVAIDPASKNKSVAFSATVTVTDAAKTERYTKEGS